VPPSVVLQVLFGESVGKAFDTLIKKGNYAFQKV